MGVLPYIDPTPRSSPTLLLQGRAPAPIPAHLPAQQSIAWAQKTSRGSPGSPLARQRRVLTVLSEDEASEVLEGSRYWCKAIPTRSLYQ